MGLPPLESIGGRHKSRPCDVSFITINLLTKDDYLDANPDVAAVVFSNGFSSGYVHFMMFGKKEGRRGGLSIYDYPDFWDEHGYLTTNSDVADAVMNGFFSRGYEHYFLFGEAEGRYGGF